MYQFCLKGWTKKEYRRRKKGKCPAAVLTDCLLVTAVVKKKGKKKISSPSVYVAAPYCHFTFSPLCPVARACVCALVSALAHVIQSTTTWTNVWKTTSFSFHHFALIKCPIHQRTSFHFLRFSFLFQSRFEWRAATDTEPVRHAELVKGRHGSQMP